MEVRQALRTEAQFRVGIITEIGGLDKSGIFMNLGKKPIIER